MVAERSLLISNPPHTSEVWGPFTSEVNSGSVYWEIPEDFMGIMNYNPRHDIQDFLDLKNLNGKISPLEYAQLLNQTVSRTKRQLEKAIGERFGVEKSTIEYFVEDGKLKSPDYPEPVLERYKKGRQFLKDNGSTETESEAAEVEGIIKVQKLLTNFSNTSEVGLDSSEVEKTKIIVISPRGPKGSLYHDNIFYVYEQKGPLFEMTRFHSTLSYQGFLKAAQTVDPTFQKPPKDTSLNPAFFLKTPIKSQKPLAEILETFALDQTTTQKYEINQQIIKDCTPLILSYISTLSSILDTSEVGFDSSEVNAIVEKIKLTLNAIYNIADITEKRIQKTRLEEALVVFKNSVTPTHITNKTFPINIDQQIDYYGRQPVRTIFFGCPGTQRGFSVTQSPQLITLGLAIGASSILDFAPFYRSSTSEDTSDFQCPGTRKDGTKCTYIVRYGSGTRKCPGCGMDATCG